MVQHNNPSSRKSEIPAKDTYELPEERMRAWKNDFDSLCAPLRQLRRPKEPPKRGWDRYKHTPRSPECRNSNARSTRSDRSRSPRKHQSHRSRRSDRSNDHRAPRRAGKQKADVYRPSNSRSPRRARSRSSRPHRNTSSRRSRPNRRDRSPVVITPIERQRVASPEVPEQTMREESPAPQCPAPKLSFKIPTMTKMVIKQIEGIFERT